MKGTYRGTMSVEDFFQALYQDRSFFEEHGITHLRSSSIYFTPCDEFGDKVVVRDEDGHLVEGYETAGCYHSAAEDYESGELLPKTVRQVKTVGYVRSRRGKGNAKKCKPS